MTSSGGCLYGQRWAARLIVPPAAEPITTDELLERARLIGSTDAESPELLASYIAAARNQVEQDIACALLTQTIQVAFDYLPILLPWPPLQAIEAASWMDVAGGSTPIDPASYVIDTLSFPARIAWTTPPVPSNPSPLQPWTFQLRIGWTPDTLPPSLRFAVGLLAAHYLTTGRDRVAIGTIVSEMPAGYDEAIYPYRLEVLA